MIKEIVSDARVFPIPLIAPQIIVNFMKSKMLTNRQEVELAVAQFREKSRDQVWNMSRVRPISNGEIKALNYIAHKPNFVKA